MALANFENQTTPLNMGSTNSKNSENGQFSTIQGAECIKNAQPWKFRRAGIKNNTCTHWLKFLTTTITTVNITNKNLKRVYWICRPPLHTGRKGVLKSESILQNFWSQKRKIFSFTQPWYLKKSFELQEPKKQNVSSL